jgi:hypothetical protein
MHLKVMTLSDIVDAQGKWITEEAFKGMKLMDQYSKLKWPRQLVTTTKHWNLWKSALQAAFPFSTTTLQVDQFPSTSMVVILQPSDPMSCHINDWNCKTIHGIHYTSENMISHGCNASGNCSDIHIIG